MRTWTSYLPGILSEINSPDLMADPKARPVTDAYLVPSPDREALQFSFPVVIKNCILEEPAYSTSAAAGAIHAMIEHCKDMAEKNPDLGALYGSETISHGRYLVNREPCTIISSPCCIASSLWRPDNQNFLTGEYLHLLLRGAVPYRDPAPAGREEMVARLLSYAEAVADTVLNTPLSLIRQDMEAAIDQENVRRMMPEIGLISFIGDGTRPARQYTRYRCWDRVAGPKDGVNIPFFCPDELDPVEMYMAGSNRTTSGLGIRKGEVFAITGSQSQGKTSLLQAIHAGEDNHAPGDGREHLVTLMGGMQVDSTNIELKGADLTPFFDRLPPGMGGKPGSAYGQGSGSTSMAWRIKEAVRKMSPYIIIDEDRSAQNLMVPCYMSADAPVHPLSSLLARERSWLGETGFLIAGSGMELLIAQADRIIRLSDHVPLHLDREEWRDGLRRYFRSLSDQLEIVGPDFNIRNDQ